MKHDPTKILEDTENIDEGEYTLEEFNEMVKGIVKRYNINNHPSQPTITSFKLTVYEDYNDNIRTDINLYRDESALEKEQREISERRTQYWQFYMTMVKNRDRERRKAKLNKLMSDPDYVKFIKLKKKFRAVK